MNLNDYQARAMSTALPTALTLHYLTPMIVGEVGEMFGAWGKAVRDGWGDEKRVDHLTKELGDVTWGVAVTAHLTEPYAGHTPHTGSYGRHRGLPVLQQLMQRALDIDYWATTEPLSPHEIPERYIYWEAVSMWNFIVDHSATLCGNHFDVVLDTNLTKLAHRAHRGAITGSGDHR